MKRVRKYTLVVSLFALLTLSAAANATAGVTDREHRSQKSDKSIIALILDFIGITLDNQISIPPG